MTGTPDGRPLHVLPVTTAGRWSLLLMLPFPLAIVLMVVLANFLGQTGGGSIADASPWLTLSLVGGVTGTLAGGLAAVYAVVARHERAVAIVLPILFAVLVFLFMAGELLIGHG